MRRFKPILALAIAGLIGWMTTASAQAQVYVYGAPVAPSVVVPAPVPAGPVVTAYRPALPAYVAPAPVTVSAYSPVVAPPRPYVAPVVTSRFSPAVVGPGIGGLPNLYVPGQPIRNALRFTLP